MEYIFVKISKVEYSNEHITFLLLKTDESVENEDITNLQPSAALFNKTLKKIDRNLRNPSFIWVSVVLTLLNLLNDIWYKIKTERW